MSCHLICKSNGEKIYFFYKKGICFIKLSEKQDKKYEMLFEKANDDFDIIIDEDTIHIICEDDEGGINYLQYEQNQWNKYMLLKSKNGTLGKKNFKILKISNFINIFYVIEYLEKRMLIHHIIDNSGRQPDALDYIGPKNGQFFPVTDDEYNIYLFFNSDSSDNLPGYMFFKWSDKSWSEFKVISDKQMNVVHGIYADNAVHLILQDNTMLYYKRIILEAFKKPNVAPEIIISDNNDIKNPIMLIANSEVWALWESIHGVSGIFSKDDGITWGCVTQFLSGRLSEIRLFGISTAVKPKSFTANQCYGYIEKNVPKPYIISNYLDEILENNNNASQVEKKEQFTGLTPDVSYADNSIFNSDIEITKLKIRLSELEEKMRRMSNILNRSPKTSTADEISTASESEQDADALDLEVN